jgi:sigma-E factor negative regulatory protein RseC
MNPENIIEHDGIVQNTDERHVYVKIFAQSACGSCHSKQMCSLSDGKEKIIEIDTPEAKTYASGDAVIVSMAGSSGWKALVLGYVIPFLLLMAALISIIEVTGKELYAGLGAISILIPYYLLLYFFKDNLKRNFEFSVKNQIKR